MVVLALGKEKSIAELTNNYDLEYERVRLIGHLIKILLWLNLAKIN
jgi:hypothetical protein